MAFWLNRCILSLRCLDGMSHLRHQKKRRRQKRAHFKTLTLSANVIVNKINIQNIENLLEIRYLGPVVRRSDSAIHRIVTFSTFVKCLKNCESTDIDDIRSIKNISLINTKL